MQINYQEIKPSAHLQPYVDCYWLQQFTETSGCTSPVQRCLPFGMVELIVHLDDNHCEVFMEGRWNRLPKVFIAGLYRDPILWRSPGNSRKFGIRLKPETMHMLFRAPASAIYSDFTSFENIALKESGLLANALTGVEDIKSVVLHIENFLTGQLHRYRRQNNYLTEAAKLMRSAKGDITIEELSRTVAVSPRQLQRTFKDQFGTSPKTYLRIIRFSHAYKDMLHLQEKEGWAGLSYDLGYADQAHFIREFKEFSGTMPKVMLLNESQVYGRVSLVG